MFTKSKNEQTRDTMHPNRNLKPARQQVNSGAPSIIGSDVRIIGNVETVGEIQLDGIVEGDIICGSLTMGEHGAVTGTLAADNLVIRGKLEGEIRAKTVRLEKTSKILGDVYHETLSIEAGAYIKGKFVHAENPAKRQQSAAMPQVKAAGLQPANEPTAKPIDGGLKATPANKSVA